MKRVLQLIALGLALVSPAYAGVTADDIAGLERTKALVITESGNTPEARLVIEMMGISAKQAGHVWKVWCASDVLTLMTVEEVPGLDVTTLDNPTMVCNVMLDMTNNIKTFVADRKIARMIYAEKGGIIPIFFCNDSSCRSLLGGVTCER